VQLRHPEFRPNESDWYVASNPDIFSCFFLLADDVSCPGSLSLHRAEWIRFFMQLHAHVGGSTEYSRRLTPNVERVLFSDVSASLFLAPIIYSLSGSAMPGRLVGPRPTKCTMSCSAVLTLVSSPGSEQMRPCLSEKPLAILILLWLPLFFFLFCSRSLQTRARYARCLCVCEQQSKASARSMKAQWSAYTCALVLVNAELIIRCSQR